MDTTSTKQLLAVVELERRDEPAEEPSKHKVLIIALFDRIHFCLEEKGGKFSASKFYFVSNEPYHEHRVF